MSKNQIGIAPLRGTIGNITFYEKDGVYRARKKSSMTKERIMKDPKFQGLRDHITELKAQVMATTSFMSALPKALKVRNGKFHLSLRSILHAINKGSPGTDGQRGVAIAQQREKLVGLQLNSTRSFNDVSKAVVQSTPAASRNSSTVAFRLDMDDVVSPVNATHARLVHQLGIVSDVEFNAVDRKYQLVSPEVNRVSAYTYSDIMPLDLAEPVDVSLTTTLPLETIPDTASVVEALAIQFYTIGAEGKLKPVNDGAAGFVVSVF